MKTFCMSIGSFLYVTTFTCPDIGYCYDVFDDASEYYIRMTNENKIRINIYLNINKPMRF
jgi:hypothetical protein